MKEPEKEAKRPNRQAGKARGRAADTGRTEFGPRIPSPAEMQRKERQAGIHGETVRARVLRPHKGDVGRPQTNEEVFQGWKERELQ